MRGRAGDILEWSDGVVGPGDGRMEMKCMGIEV
jgi:hypothetical protein